MAWRIAALSFLLVCQSSMARDVNGNYATFGVGSQTCADYLDARDTGGESEQLFMEWTAGHLSAYNLLLVNTYNILGETSTFDMLAHLDSYCRQNQDAAYIQALAVQIESLYDVRANLSPAHSGWKDWLKDVRGGKKAE
jgi:hypothetical protein